MHGLSTISRPLIMASLPNLTHGLGRRCQPEPTHACFSCRAWAMVQAQKPASWLVLTHASLVRMLFMSTCGHGLRRCECTCSQRRTGPLPCSSKLVIFFDIALELLDTVKGSPHSILEKKLPLALLVLLNPRLCPVTGTVKGNRV